MVYHIPVLVHEVITHLAIKPGGVYVDVTFGGGGHTRAILQADPTCRVIAFDWDPQSFEKNREAFEQEFPGRITWIWKNFAQLAMSLKKEGITAVDGILADFGTSQHQISNKPGFSFTHNATLDMRMSPGYYKVTAHDIVNTASELELATIFWDYGGERFGRPIAQAICEARQKQAIRTTHELAKIVESVVGKRSGNIHGATRVFQALRIVVNKELEHIHAFLVQAPAFLKPGGRLVCISFHSLEDRLVKRAFKDINTGLRILTKKVVCATEEELAINASARSAKLRAAEKK